MIGWTITYNSTFGGARMQRRIPDQAFKDAHTLADYVGDMARSLTREQCERVADRLQVYKWAPEQSGNFTAEPIPDQQFDAPPQKRSRQWGSDDQ